MKTILKAFGLALLASVIVSPARANLIINGGFENPGTLNSGGFGLYTSILGWQSAPGGPQIEIGRGTTYGVTGFEGLNVLEIDSTANATVSQVVTTVGSQYLLSFLYGLRVNDALASDTFDVLWNNTVVASVAPASTAMSYYSVTVTGTGSDTLSFVGTGTPNGRGGIIDDVQLNAVPDSTASFALLGLSLAGLACARRKRR